MQITENVRDIMRSPEYVLNSLTEHSENLNYKFERLYRIFFNEEMYYVAYQRIYAKPGNMTAGADGKTIDGMSLTRIADLIDLLRKMRHISQNLQDGCIFQRKTRKCDC